MSSWRDEINKRRRESVPPSCPRCKERKQVIPVVYGGMPDGTWKKLMYRFAVWRNLLKPTDAVVGRLSPTHYCKNCKFAFQDKNSVMTKGWQTTRNTGPIVQEPNYMLPTNVKVKTGKK